MATTGNRSNKALKEAMTKPQLLNALSESTGLQKKDVALVPDELGVLIERHIKETCSGNVHASGPAENQGGAQAGNKVAQDDLALHRPGNYGGREARFAGGQGSTAERAEACKRECIGRCRPSAAACLLLCRLNRNSETG